MNITKSQLKILTDQEESMSTRNINTEINSPKIGKRTAGTGDNAPAEVITNIHATT